MASSIEIIFLIDSIFAALHCTPHIRECPCSFDCPSFAIEPNAFGFFPFLQLWIMFVFRLVYCSQTKLKKTSRRKLETFIQFQKRSRHSRCVPTRRFVDLKYVQLNDSFSSTRWSISNAIFFKQIVYFLKTDYLFSTSRWFFFTCSMRNACMMLETVSNPCTTCFTKWGWRPCVHRFGWCSGTKHQTSTPHASSISHKTHFRSTWIQNYSNQPFTGCLQAPRDSALAFWVGTEPGKWRWIRSNLLVGNSCIFRCFVCRNKRKWGFNKSVGPSIMRIKITRC